MLAFVTAGFADTLTLRSGQVVSGTYMGGTARTVKMEMVDAIRTFDVADIASLQFTAPAAAAVEIPAGTAFTVRMIDSADRETARSGQTLRGRLDTDIAIGGRRVIRRGSAAIVKPSASVVSVRVNGRMVDIPSCAVTPIQPRVTFVADRRVRI